MKWCSFSSTSRFICNVKRQLAYVQLHLQVATMNTVTDKQDTPVEKNKRKHNKRKDLERSEQNELKKEVECDLQSTASTDNFERPVSKYLCKSAASTLSGNSNHDYNKTVQSTNTIDSYKSLSPEHNNPFNSDTSSVTQSNTNNLLSGSPVKGTTFVRNNTAYAPNMVPNVASLFQMATQYYKAFGVYPQYNPFGHGSGMVSSTLLQTTPTGFPRQYRTATPSAAPADKGDGYSAAGIVGHPRQWEYTEYGKRHRSKAKQGVEISVMSYNILSQCLLEDHPYLYEFNGDYALCWNYRSKLLLQEIAFHRSDVVCLQEVESNHYKDLINPEFQKLGYEGVYQKRTGFKSDGCAIFFKQDKFSLVKSHQVKFCRGGLLDRDNIAVILELRPRSKFYNGSVKKLCFATTHLLFNPRRGDVKMAQLMVLLAELDKCARLSDGTYVPIVLCGDFNMEPHSHLYRMICDGHLHYEGLNCKILSGQKEGYSGRDVFLERNFCPSLNIDDNCQYMVVKDRTTKLKDEIGEESSVAATDKWKISTRKKRKTSAVHKSGKDSPSTTAGTLNVSALTDWSPDEGAARNAVDVNCENDNNNQESKNNRGSGHVRHPLNLVSSYRHHIERLHTKPAEVTTQHKKAACTVDYIFYNVLHKEFGNNGSRQQKPVNVKEGHLRLLARYGLMSFTEINERGVMPNPMMPSDHLPLITKFLLKL